MNILKMRWWSNLFIQFDFYVVWIKWEFVMVSGGCDDDDEMD